MHNGVIVPISTHLPGFPLPVNFDVCARLFWDSLYFLCSTPLVLLQLVIGWLASRGRSRGASLCARSQCGLWINILCCLCCRLKSCHGLGTPGLIWLDKWSSIGIDPGLFKPLCVSLNLFYHLARASRTSGNIEHYLFLLQSSVAFTQNTHFNVHFV